MYDKDKPDKCFVHFLFWLTQKHYLIYHLDVYQGNNKANIDISHLIDDLSITQKAAENAILKLGINNDVDDCHYIFMDKNNVERGLFVRLINKRLGMVITRWKYSRVLQTVSTIIKPGVNTIGRWAGFEISELRYPSDIIEY